MKTIFTLIVLLAGSQTAFAQTQQFDVVSYRPIKGWKQERTDKYVSFSSFDEVKGRFCIISIYPSQHVSGDSQSNFDRSWQEIVRKPLNAKAPKMEAPGTQNGWTLQTGAAQFDKEGLSGIATLITATGNHKMVNMLILMNSDVYGEALQQFIASIELQANQPAPAAPNVRSDITGIWLSNILETSGFMNNMPQYTSGYFRREYKFNKDGTYLFLEKNWSAYGKVIQFAIETGTWTITEDKLTVSPTRGETQEWSKSTSGRANEWGKLLKSGKRKLEKVTYTFGTNYYSGSDNTSLELFYVTPTERDGSSRNSEGIHRAVYSGKTQSIIDYPPGLKW